MTNNKDIVTLYNNGLTIRQISEKTGIKCHKVNSILKEEKVTWKRRYLSDLSEVEIKEITNKFSNNITIKEIAKEHTISAPAISRLLKLKGFEVISSLRKYDILRQSSISKRQQDFIVGTLLGDGCLYKEGKNTLYKLSFCHCEAQFEYFHWKVAYMDPFINGFNKNVDKRGNSVMYHAATICHKDYKKFADMFYDENRKKSVPNNLDMYLTPLSLAVWFCDDGNLNEGVNARFSTMGFDYKDHEKLQSYLLRCFDLRSKIFEYKYKSKLYYGLSMNKKNTQKLSDIIRPHIVECMKYKIMPPLEPSTTTCQTFKKNDDIV